MLGALSVLTVGVAFASAFTSPRSTSRLVAPRNTTTSTDLVTTTTSPAAPTATTTTTTTTTPTVRAPTIGPPVTPLPTGASPSVWQVSAAYGAVPGVEEMSCPSTSVCYASGSNSSQAGDVLVTTDSGAIWNDTTLPPGTGGITSIACPSNSICFAGDNRGVLLTTNFGATWRQEQINSAAVGVTDIACPWTSTCYALPSGESVAVYITTDSGEIWRDSPVRSAAGEPQIWALGYISCPSVTTCFAENNQADFVTTTDSGAVWENEDQAFAAVDDGQDFGSFVPFGVDVRDRRRVGFACYHGLGRHLESQQ